MNNEKSDDDLDTLAACTTPASSRPSTPVQVNRTKDSNSVNKLVYQIHRDTLINESNDCLVNGEQMSSPLSVKRSAAPPPIPARNHVTVDLSLSNNGNDSARAMTEQPPDLPPKTLRALASGSKYTLATNPIMNKENQTVPIASAPFNDVPLIQRTKSKNNRRKMTEEEAIQELGW
jgi:hypothetical protein